MLCCDKRISGVDEFVCCFRCGKYSLPYHNLSPSVIGIDLMLDANVGTSVARIHADGLLLEVPEVRLVTEAVKCL